MGNWKIEKIIKDHLIFDVLLCAKASHPATCVIVANAVCKGADTINDNTIWFQFIVYIFLFLGSYY